MIKEKHFLKDTSLCAIVKNAKNKKFNIIKYLESIVPYVESAVIVDTGSEDGTLDILRDYEHIYSNLYIYEREFDNFYNSRNFSLSKADCSNILILDADEVIDELELSKLKRIIEGDNYKDKILGVNFKFYNIGLEDNTFDKNGSGQSVRLFKNNKGISFKNFNGWEYPFYNDKRLSKEEKEIFASRVYITHYINNQYEDYSKYPRWIL
jgi:glycosyltransferase involved in cell wall biosynthesis